MSNLLQRLADARIFSIQPKDEGWEFVEECDRWFGQTLTPAEVRQLAAELIALVDKTEGKG